MASIFNTLNVGYTGLNAAQFGVTTTSHNISNAETEGYTRQRVITSPSTPLTVHSGQLGNGVDITAITRIFDNFVYERYSKLARDKEYTDFTQRTLEELSTYFPEIDEVGIKADLQEYYNMWQNLSDNPGNDSIKLALAKQTENLTQNINYTQEKILALQSRVNDQLNVNILEVNALAEELAALNKSIHIAESVGDTSANDLRDKRNLIELGLSKLIGADVHIGEIKSDSRVDTSSNKAEGSYTLSVNGFNIVDGSSFHPIRLDNNNANSFHTLAYEDQNAKLIPMNNIITGGRVGAILDLRGSEIDDTTSGIPTNGVIQGVLAKLDAFAKGLIESTNNLYAASNTTRMESNHFNINPTNSLITSGLNVEAGAFDIIIYDVDGNETARRTIDIDIKTSMTGGIGSNSIEDQVTRQGDDNNDSNATNDIDDFISNFNFITYANGDNGLEIVLDTSAASKGYTFSIQDNLKNSNYNSGSNFAGALGLNRYFDGNSARDIDLNSSLRENSSLISAAKSTSVGDNTLALNMMQQQFEVHEFHIGDNSSVKTTTYGMFDIVATEVGIQTNKAILNNDSTTAQYNATEKEYASVSKVSIDEELTNLIRYQTAYGAASKIITTIDQMMQTLLGIKQ